MSKRLKKMNDYIFFDLYEKNINKFKKEYEIRKNKKLTYGFYLDLKESTKITNIIMTLWC